MRDLTILMDDVVGRPAAMLSAAASAGIEIEAACLFPRLGGRVAHIAVSPDQVTAIKTVVEEHGGVVADDRECVVVPADREGGPAGVAEVMSEAGIAVLVSYFGRSGEMVLATTDVAAARAALGLES